MKGAWRAPWWFAKMRATVANAMDWQAVNPIASGTNLDARREPRSEDLNFKSACLRGFTGAPVICFTTRLASMLTPPTQA